MRVAFLVIFGSLLLVGCVGRNPPSRERGEQPLPPQGQSPRPEDLLFPDYLLMADFEIDQYGRIPENTLVGAEMMTELDLADTLRRFTEVLDARGWSIHHQEVAIQSFRLMAGLKDATVEIRAVQGSGLTKVFLLYQPAIDPRP